MTTVESHVSDDSSVERSHQPYFSVVMPTWNRDYVIWKAITSVLAQDFPRFELIVVDDGSTDHTLRLLEEFQDPRVRAISVPHGGQSCARNVGLRAARAAFTAYLDSDNTWERAFLRTFYEAIEQNHESTLWFCRATTTFFERTQVGKWRVTRYWEPSSEELQRRHSMEDAWSGWFPDTNAMVHRTEVGLSVGGWDEQCRWLEDWDFFLRIAIHYPISWKSVGAVPLVNYRQVHGDGADGVCSETARDTERDLAAREYLVHKWSQHPDFKFKRHLLRQAAQRSVGPLTE